MWEQIPIHARALRGCRVGAESHPGADWTGKESIGLASQGLGRRKVWLQEEDWAVV